MAQVQSFSCPTCGASLATDGNQLEVQCPYCGNEVIVPQSLRNQQALTDQQAPQVPLIIIGGTTFNPLDASASNLAAVYPPRRRRGCGCSAIVLALIILTTVALPIIISAGLAPVIIESVQQAMGTAGVPVSIISTVNALKPTSEVDISGVFGTLASTQVSARSSATTAAPAKTATPAVTAVPGFGSVLLSFGSKGTGAGLFDDARGVAVDGSGSIYVSEYTSGRIQKFDATGQFIKGWIPTGKTPIRALAADQNTNVYAIRDSAILKYNGGTGDLITKFKSTDNYDDIATTLDGGFVAVAASPNDDFVRYNAKGTQVSRIKKAISSQIQTAVIPRVAVDGQGNIYAVESLTWSVFKFGADGKFVTKFGGKGDEPGQIHAPQAIAIDKQGRVFVSDINGIQIFSADGRFIERMSLPKPSLVAFGMTFNAQGDLLIAARDQVLKLKTTH